MTAIDVQLRAKWIENVGYRYYLILAGETIVSRSRDPEHDAARVLHGRGLGGKFRTIDFNTGRPRMILDIGKAARLRVVERDDGGPPAVVPDRPLSDEVRTLLRAHTSHQGGAIRSRTASGSQESLRRRGGEGCAESGQQHAGKESVGENGSDDADPGARLEREEA